MAEVYILPLVPDVPLPLPAPAVARAEIPAGYGVQEQCVPFTDATALGLLIPSPITFGLGLPAEVPRSAHAFRSPADRCGADGAFDDARVFYVADSPRCRFANNAFSFDTLDLPGSGRLRFNPKQPGLSFFDRGDQHDLFKLHLPYLWRTADGLDTLYLPPINRGPAGFEVLCGLVETDWYANPVNLVLRKPTVGRAVHVAAGDPIAQAVTIAREQRRPEVALVSEHARRARELRRELAQWYQQHGQDRSAYKRLARSHHGRV